MLKLYKRIDGVLHYWETWDKDDKTGIIHWGIVGEKGDTKEIKSGLLSNFRKVIQKEIDLKMQEGYQTIDDEDNFTLMVEYAIDNMGTSEDIAKRHRLETRLKETLGWRGLGDCDGGSIGSGTMEVCCFVVDFDTAKNTIEQDLKETEFANFTRIYDENNK